VIGTGVGSEEGCAACVADLVVLFLVVVSETEAGLVVAKGSCLLGAGKLGWFKGQCELRGRAFVYSDFGGQKEKLVAWKGVVAGWL
jgi:hypothetical protein